MTPTSNDGKQPRLSDCACSLIIPTLNRCDVLGETLSRLQLLPDSNFETIVVDNGSTDGTVKTLSGRFPQVHWIELGKNRGAAARNAGAAAAVGRVLVMLDDDSWPAHGTLDRLASLFNHRLDLGAVACRVRLADPPQRHDAGGVPGIFFNCGGAIRRTAFMEVGGFPEDFDYYVEEYDLCCRLWQRGWCVEPRGDTLVWHRRVSKNRDNDRMLRLLVRNNLRLWQRYAPDEALDALIASTLERYRRVAVKENAMKGYEAGLEEGRADIAAQKIRRTPLFPRQLDDLFGLTRAKRALSEWADNHSIKNVAIWTRGKGCEQLLETLSSFKIRLEGIYDHAVETDEWHGVALRDIQSFRPESVDGIVIGSLSPGVAEDACCDAAERYGQIPILSPAPWETQCPTPTTTTATASA